MSQIIQAMRREMVLLGETEDPAESLEASASTEVRLKYLEMRADMMQMTPEAMFDHLTMQWESR